MSCHCWQIIPSKVINNTFTDIWNTLESQQRNSTNGSARRDVVRSVVEYMRHMMSEGSASGTVVIVVNDVKSFMAANSLSFPIRKNDIPTIRTNGSKLVTIEEIRALYDTVPNLNKARNRAVIMVLKDTGLRISDITRLTVEDYHNARIVETDKGNFRVFQPFSTQKTGEIAYIHLGPEAVEATENYLDGRTSGPLFLDRYGLAMSSNAITMIIRRNASWVDNLDKVSPHSFRKTHRTLLESRMSESYVKKLQGKSTDSYIHPEQTGELTRAYVEHYDVLRVFVEAQRFEEVKQKLSEYRSNQTSKIMELETQLEYLTDAVSKLMLAGYDKYREKQKT